MSRQQKTVNVRTWGTSCAAYADEHGIVRVYDATAGHFTVCHSLTPTQEHYVRSRTAPRSQAR